MSAKRPAGTLAHHHSNSAATRSRDSCDHCKGDAVTHVWLDNGTHPWLCDTCVVRESSSLDRRDSWSARIYWLINPEKTS